MRHNQPWTNEEDLFLLENYEEMTNKELSKELSRTEVAVMARLHLLGMTRDVIYALYRDDEMLGMGTAKELAEELGYKESTIYFYANYKGNDRRITAIRV